MNATDVACPKCGAGQGEKCRTLKTRRVTDTHEARYAQMNMALDAQMRRERLEAAR